MISIEHYSEKHFDSVYSLVEKFYFEYLTEHYDKISPEKLKSVINMFSGDKSNNSFLVINEGKCVGLLAGIEVSSEINGQKFFQEILWYIENPFGIYVRTLIEFAKNSLRERGFSSIIMSVFGNAKSLKTQNFLTSLDFQPLEQHYASKL